MHESYVTDETWAFDCRRCGHHWSIDYELQHTAGFGDEELRLWFRNGLPAMAPGAGVPCPHCGGLRVAASRPNTPLSSSTGDAGTST
ncbi:hypothetical protein [Phytoactinopolyspora halophila]|uniref:hypothetical protein n=1 Tax=Phytoactinopolyspora halophila TaxID=1981511 RepID=UPI000F4DEFBB|nr:hypothetical protein [Phytoactinopolyspora halophila]